MAPNSNENEILNIPNIITLCRLILVPMCVYLILESRLTAALFVFALAGVSDGIDGFLARYLNQKTALGAFLDPLADKMLLVSSFITLSLKGFIPFWLTLVVVARDTMILSGILRLWLSGIRFEIKPRVLSKLTTFLQLVSVFLTLLFADAFHVEQARSIAFVATFFFTLFSGIEYLIVGLKIVRNNN